MIGLAVALVHSLWQGVVAMASVAVLDRVVARERADARHAIRVLALGGWLVAFCIGLAAARSGSGAAAILEPVAPWAGALSWIWIGGVAIGSMHVTIGALRVASWRRGAIAVPASVQALADRIARSLGIAAIRVAQHARIAVPCVVGIVRPVVLLPLGACTGLPPAVLRTVLVHELVHVRRFDPWINAMIVIATTLLFHHPAAWWLAREIRAEREHACDELAAMHCDSRLAYARALVDLAAWRPVTTRLPVGIPAILPDRRDGLRHRVARLLTPQAIARPRRARWIAAVLAVLAALAIAPGPVDARGGAASSIPWLPSSVRRHEAAIAEAAARHGVDPDLLAIVVLVESGGDPNATSPVGARGLMQVMPATADEVARAIGRPAPSLADLHDPEVSLDLGAAYLAAQLRAAASMTSDPARRIEIAAAAYNGGPARARRWLAGAALPAETDAYRRRVAQLWRERTMPSSPTLSR